MTVILDDYTTGLLSLLFLMSLLKSCRYRCFCFCHHFAYSVTLWFSVIFVHMHSILLTPIALRNSSLLLSICTDCIMSRWLPNSPVWFALYSLRKSHVTNNTHPPHIENSQPSSINFTENRSISPFAI